MQPKNIGKYRKIRFYKKKENTRQNKNPSNRALSLILFKKLSDLSYLSIIRELMNEQFNNRLYTTPSRELSASRPRFQRQTTPPSRSNSSKSSQATPINQKYIRFDTLSRNSLDPDHFFSGFSKEMVDVRSDEDTHSHRKATRPRQNAIIQIQTLEADLEDAHEEIGKLKKENGRVKMAMEREIERRKNSDRKAQETAAQLAESQRKCKEYELQTVHLNKQVKFLEDVKLNREERALLTLREKALAEEIHRIRTQHHGISTSQFLQKEVQRLQQVNDSLVGENHVLKIAQRTILIRLLHFQKQLSLAVKLEEEFHLLRDKYQQLADRERLQRRELERERRKHPHPTNNTHHTNNSMDQEEDLFTISSSSSEPIRQRQLKLKSEAKRHCRMKPNGC